MLILVGVTINVALNGGLFTKGRDAARLTKQAQVSEAVALAKAELLSRFYSAKTNADRAVPTDVAELVQSYLDKEDINNIVKITPNNISDIIPDVGLFCLCSTDRSGFLSLQNRSRTR